MMTTPRLFCYLFILGAACQKVFTEDVEEYSKISAKKSNHIKIEEEIRKIGLRSQKLPILPFISHLTHNGDNLFFQPQIVMGSTISGPFAYAEPHQETEENEIFTSSKEIILSDKTESLTAEKLETIRETKPCNKEPATTTEKEVPLIVIPEPPAFIPLNPPQASSLFIENMKVTDHQVSTVEDSSAEITGTEIEITKPIVIPEPPAYIPLNPPTLPFKIIPSTPKCPPIIPEVFKIPICPPSISEKYKIFVCPSFELPKYEETHEINEIKIQPHLSYFLPGKLSIPQSIVKFTKTADPR